MAIQDDIMAMLSQVSDAGDQATGRGRLGAKLYSDLIEGDIANRLSVDDRKKAMREIDMLGDSMQFGSLEEQMQVDPLTGDRVATIIEKYMADAEDGVPIPSDMLVDDTRAAEGMMEVLPSPNTAPRIPVNAEQLAPLPSPALDASAMDSMEREIRGQDEGLAGLLIDEGRESDMAGMLVGEPDMAGMLVGEPDMAGMSVPEIPLKERLFAGQDAAGGPMSGSGQLALASAFIPATMLPAAAAQIGMRTAQIAQYLRAGKVGRDALRRIIQEGVAKQGGRVPGRRSRGPVQGPAQPPMQGPAQPPMQGPKPSFRVPYRTQPPMQGPKPSFRVPARSRNSTQEKLYDQMQNPGGPTGGLARGGAVRDNIMNTYGRM